MVYVIASVGSNKNNVTGAGNDYEIDWDGSIVDPYGIWSNNKFTIDNQFMVNINLYLKLGGLSVLNTDFDVWLYTSNGDVHLYSANPSGSLLSTLFNLNLTRMMLLNTTDISGFTANVGISVSNGLSNSVDVLADSSFTITF